jgi:HSP20 family protein
MHSKTADLALENLERLIARDPLLRDIVHPTLPAAKRSAKFRPAVDVLESEEAWTLLLEVPGIPRASLKIRLDGTRLTISGDKPPRRIGRIAVSEREVGPFSREFLLPFQVQPDGIHAHLEEGLLIVTLPRSGASNVREVPIEVPGDEG